jgi:predicted lipoprotein DUF2279
MIRLVAILFCILTSLVSQETSSSHFRDRNESKKDILYTNLVGAAVITAWGVANWEYGANTPSRDDEEWFGKETKSGGADKLGHLYATYAIGSGLSGLYESWGYTEDDAALYGSISSFFLMNYMEVGDAFSSEYGFSYEDFLMNTIGAFSSYLFYTCPELSRRVDLRVEYIPSFDTADVITEYERMKYLIALKAEGFESVSNPYLKYAELHLGYYTRNYQGGYSSQSERIVYLGIGINLSRVFRENAHTKTARFLNYYQLPYTYIPFEKDLND